MTADFVTWRCEVAMPRADCEAMARKVVLLIPIDPDEGKVLMQALAIVERHVESAEGAEGADAVGAFWTISAAFARARLIGPRRLDA